MQSNKRVIAGDTRRVGSGAHRDTHFEHPPDRRCSLRGLRTVAVDEVLALIRHPVLNRDTPAKSSDPLDIPIGNGLRVIEEPAQFANRVLTVDALEHVEGTRDGFVVGGVHPKRPAIPRQDRHDVGQLRFHGRRHFRSRLQKVLEVRRREDEHLARSVHAVELVTIPGPRDAHPFREVVRLVLWSLREEVVRDADAELSGFVKLSDHAVVVGIVLKSAAGVDRARDAEPVELAHEMARRVDLVLSREPGPLGQRRVEDVRVRLRDQHARRIARLVALYLGADRVRSVLGVSDGL